MEAVADIIDEAAAAEQDAADFQIGKGATKDDRSIDLGRERRRKAAEKAADKPKDLPPPKNGPEAQVQNALPGFEGIAMENWILNLSGRAEYSGMLATQREWLANMELGTDVTLTVKCRVAGKKFGVKNDTEWNVTEGGLAVSLKVMEVTGCFDEPKHS